MNRKQTCLLLLLLLVFANSNYAQPGNRRIRSDKNAYRGSYQRMSAGANFTLEIRSGGLWAYGRNGTGQLGDGTFVSRDTPEQIGTATNWVSISAGASHSLGIRADGTLWAWGWNLYGNLGDSTNTNRTVPVQIGTGANWIDVAAGNEQSLAIRGDGTLWSWGRDSSGQLGDGANVDRNFPAQVGSATNWVSVVAGYDRSFALQSDGTLWCWGDNTYGWLGTGSLVSVNVPVQIDTTHNWVSVSSGPDHAMALKSDGTLWAWGTNTVGQLGDGTTVKKIVPEQIGTAQNWVTIASGGYHSAAITADGSLWAWGQDADGQLGDNGDTDQLTPVRIAPGTKWVAVSAGGSYTLGLTANGQLNGWGNDSIGQLGLGNNIDQTTPQPISTVVNWVKMTPTAHSTLALLSDGTLWAWGENGSGEFGDSIFSGSKIPRKVSNATWIDMTGGLYHTLGLKQDGTLWAWGDNYFGQVGNGTNSGMPQYVPVKVSPDTDWTALTAGYSFSMALKSNGTIWTWGSNSYGQLGRQNGNYLTPQQMGTDTDWISIEAGSDPQGIEQSLALKSNGTLWAWGANSVGQLGTGGSSSSVPVQVGTNNNWVALAAGQGVSLAIRADGTLWGWGLNAYGSVGNGSANNQPTPVQIAPGTNNWIKIGAGTLQATGLHSDGSLWGWGYNFSGQLGNGNTGNQSTPVPTVPPTGWCDLGATSEASSSLAIKADRLSYCAAGENNLAQLGDGTNVDKDYYSCTMLIQPVQPVAKFTANTTSVCPGSTVTFTDQSTGPATGWRWTFTGGTPDTSSTQNPVVTYSVPGVYPVKLVVTNSVGRDSLAKTAYITVNAAPVAGTVIGPGAICSGNSFQLSDTGRSGPIQWQSSANGSTFANMAGDTSAIINIDFILQTTYYRVKAASCGTDTSLPVKVQVNPFPVPVVSTNDSLICASDSTLITSSGPYVSYLWNDGDSTSSTYVGKAGNNWVLVTDSNGCQGASNHLNILVYPVPSVSIDVQGDTLSSFNSNFFQWFLDDTMIPGANSPVYVARQTGDYAVQIIDTNGCKELSSSTFISITGISELYNSAAINVYPDPFSNLIYIKASGAAAQIEYAEVYDELGDRIISRTMSDKPAGIIEVNTSMLAEGAYYLKIMVNGISYVKRIVKQN